LHYRLTSDSIGGLVGNGKENGRNYARAEQTTCFLLLEPGGFGNAGEVAKRIARCRGVKEVHLTSGRYGFVVSAKASTAEDLNRISTEVKKAVGSRSASVVVSHLVYR
jgi:DNA-binding Lrp family transcriptional regulator